MKPPESAEVFETATSKYWYEGGILCIITQKAPGLPFDEHKKRMEAFRVSLAGNKICAVMDITNSSITSAKNREYNHHILPEIFKAIAFVSETALGKMLVNLYLGMQPPSFPTKVFSNEKDAKEWVSKYL
jgi:hypothetical protein